MTLTLITLKEYIFKMIQTANSKIQIQDVIFNILISARG
jgi:hypothetical protein